MKNGETRSKPRSANVCCCSAIVAMPPIAEPTRIPTRVGSMPSRPASSQASCAAATASRTLRSIRRASFAGTSVADLEPSHLGGDPHGVLGGVERLDPADSAPAGHRRVPGRTARPGRSA